MKIGTRVKVERDEEKYPPKGYWKRVRGKTGVVTGTSHGEIGVSFEDDGVTDAWFHPYELKVRK